MNYENINFEEIKLEKPYINVDNNLEISVLYKDDNFSIKIPENYNDYFKIVDYDINNSFFNSYINLGITSMDDRYYSEYIFENKELYIQKETLRFKKFILTLKSYVMKLFFNEVKINDNFLDKIKLKELDLEYFEINNGIWNENIDFSLIPEIINESKEKDDNLSDDKEELYEEDDIDNFNNCTKGLENMVFRNILYVNKISKKKLEKTLKCNIIFINKILEDKKHIYINWIID